MVEGHCVVETISLFVGHFPSLLKIIRPNLFKVLFYDTRILGPCVHEKPVLLELTRDPKINKIKFVCKANGCGQYAILSFKLLTKKQGQKQWSIPFSTQDSPAF